MRGVVADEIIKVARAMTGMQLQQLLLAWDRCAIRSSLHLNTADFFEGGFHINPGRRRF